MTNRTDWGLTELGFRRPSYDEILDGFEYQARERFTKDGKTPNLSSRSFIGVCLRIWAWAMNILFQLLEDVYNSQFVDTAVGSSLYQLGKNIGLRLLPAQRSGGYVEVTGTPNTIIPAGYLFGTIAAILFFSLQNDLIGSNGTVIIPVQCKQAGTIGNVPKNTITDIINPIEGIMSVNNPSAMSGGREKETDSEFRDRYYRSIDLVGGVNADGLNSLILQEVEGVLSSRVYENETDETDEYGRPPHSIHAVVFGGIDHSVAQTIYKKVAGIQTFGSTMVPIISPQNGQIYEIKFTRPSPVAIHFTINNLLTNKSFPLDGKNQIAAALLAYIGSDITGGLGIGEDVIYNQLPCHVLRVPGVIDFDMVMGTSPIALSKNNIAISDLEKAVTSRDIIEINLVLDDSGGVA